MSAFSHEAGASADFIPPRMPPAERNLGLVSFLTTLIRNPIAAWPKRLLEEPMVVQNVGGQLVVFVSDPELLRQVMVKEPDRFQKNPLDRRLYGPLLGNSILTSEGNDWRLQRRTAAPLFRHAMLERYVPIMVEAAQRVLTQWELAGSSSVQQIDPAMMRATFEVVARALLPENHEFDMATIEKATDDYLAGTSWELAFGLLHLPSWLPHPKKRRALEGARTIRALLDSIITQRQQSDSGADDLLGRLLAASDPHSGCPMARRTVLDNIATFMIAGHETTYSTLTWAIYLLASTPDWQGRLIEEVNLVTGGGPVTASHLDQLVLCQQVLKEALRLYPPAPILSRMATKDVEIGGRQFAKGTMFFVPVHAVHRHPKIWVDPDKFDPARFTADAEASLPRCSFMPWGAGPRTCMGASFSLMEATSILATLMQRVRFSRAGRPEPVPVCRIALRPKDPLSLRVSFGQAATTHHSKAA
jgi:cytochrome P450